MLLLVVAIGFSGCNKDDDSLEQQYKAIDAYIAKKNLQGVVTTESGLRYVVTEEGTGDFPQAGQTVAVHYEGTKLNDSKFDSSYDRGEPIEFKLGIDPVIKGWTEGIALLKVGSSATFIIPSNLAYGPQGYPPVIAPNEALVFRVELLSAE